MTAGNDRSISPDVTTNTSGDVMTGKVAELFGLRGRGTLVEGAFADVVVFDPDTIGSEPASLVHDLPGGAPRMCRRQRLSSRPGGACKHQVASATRVRAWRLTIL